MRLTPRLRRFALIVHITASVGWLGAVAAFLGLAIAGLTKADSSSVRAAYVAMDIVGWYVIVPLSLASLASGLIQSLATEWGLFRHYWVLIKFLLNLGATALLLLHMQPTTHLARAATRCDSGRLQTSSRSASWRCHRRRVCAAHRDCSIHLQAVGTHAIRPASGWQAGCFRRAGSAGTRPGTIRPGRAGSPIACGRDRSPFGRGAWRPLNSTPRPQWETIEHMTVQSQRPKAVLFDFGGTLVEETGFDIRTGNEWLVSRAASRPAGLTLDAIVDRAQHIGRLVIARRDEVGVETPWPAISRLIFGHFGVEFAQPLQDLELGFWRAAVRTRPLPNLPETLDRLASSGIRMAIVSNTSFTARTLHAELELQRLADHFEFIITSADYSVRKPNPLLFEMAATRLALPPSSIWFVGDRLEADVAGANASGMTSVLLGTVPADGTPSPSVTLPAWSEFAHWS